MLKPLTIAATALVAAFASATAHADAEGAVKRAANATVRGLEKAQEVVVRVAKKGAAGATHGVEKAGEAVSHVAKKVGLPTEQSAPPKDTSKTE